MSQVLSNKLFRLDGLNSPLLGDKDPFNAGNLTGTIPRPVLPNATQVAKGAVVLSDAIDQMNSTVAASSAAVASAVVAISNASNITSGTLSNDRLSTPLRTVGGLTISADRLPYYTGASTASLAVFTSTGRGLVSQSSKAQARTYLETEQAGNITSGTLSNDRLTTPLRIVGDLNISADRLPYFTGASTAALTTLTTTARGLLAQGSTVEARTYLETNQAGNITSGTFATDRIPNLDASKITSGVFTTARIPNLDASKIGTGIFATDRIPNLDASKITSGTLSIAGGGTGSNTSTGTQSNVLSHEPTLTGTVQIQGNLQVTGDYVVTGEAIFYNPSYIDDPWFEFNRGETGQGVSNDFSGVHINRGSLETIRFGWSESEQAFVLQNFLEAFLNFGSITQSVTTSLDWGGLTAATSFENYGSMLTTKVISEFP